MKLQMPFLVALLLLSVCGASSPAVLAVKNSPQESLRRRTGELQESERGRDRQESERFRKRDEWQRPGEVMDGIGVGPGQRVADIGCGFGYFTFHLAARVGAEGKVYAVDIDQAAIEIVRQRKEREELEQVEPILGESADPRLPNNLDAVLIVDTYHEFREYDQTMQAVFRALKPGGRLAIIDGEGPAGRPRTEYHRLHTIPADLVREEIVRHGFVFKEDRPGFYDEEYGKKFYFLIFEKPAANSAPTSKGQVQQAPSLVAEAGHSVRDSRGDGAQSFRIASAILKETRRVYIALPASYSHSAPDHGLGYMNGMRPRGVILFEGILEGDILSGKMRLGGVDFRLPNGSRPSSFFSFKRVRK